MFLAQDKQQDQQRRIVASLAEDSDVPVADVATLFERERAELAIGARITTFLNIFAIRHVQEILRKRNADKPPAPFGVIQPHAA